jgi:ABC-type glycerol-3-phosphate transport system substrate-binding protein
MRKTCILALVLSLFTSVSLFASGEAGDTDAAADTGKRVLKVMIDASQVPSVKAYNGITDGEFEKKFNVEVEYVPVTGSLADHIARLNQLLVSKDTEHGILQSWDAVLPVFADTGLMLPLDGLFPKELTDDLIQWDFYTVDGKHYGWNWVNDVNVMYIRLDMMREAGLDPDEVLPITNMDEMRDLGEALTQRDAAGNTTIAGFCFQSGALDQYYQFFSAFGAGKLYNDDGTPNIATPEAAQGLKYITDMFKDGILARDSPNTVVHTFFLDGQAGSCWSWPYFPHFAIPQFGKENLGYNVIPNNGGGVAMTGHAYYLNGFAPKETQELAVEWIKWFMNPEAFRYYMSIFAFGPPFLSLLLDDELRAEHPAWQVMLDMLRTREITSRPGLEMTAALTQAFTDVTQGGKDPLQALQDAEATVPPDLNTVNFGGFNIGTYWKDRLAGQ